MFLPFGPSNPESGQNLLDGAFNDINAQHWKMISNKPLILSLSSSLLGILIRIATFAEQLPGDRCPAHT